MKIEELKNMEARLKGKIELSEFLAVYEGIFNYLHDNDYIKYQGTEIPLDKKMQEILGVIEVNESIGLGYIGVVADGCSYDVEYAFNVKKKVLEVTLDGYYHLDGDPDQVGEDYYEEKEKKFDTLNEINRFFEDFNVENFDHSYI